MVVDATGGFDGGVGEFTPDSMSTVMTLRQYVRSDHERMRNEYGLSLVEIEGLYPKESYESRWYGYLSEEVNAGRLPSTRLWRSLTLHQQSGLLRTTRALGDNAFTHRLVSMTDQTRNDRT